jgi:hypothetical protein
LDVYFFDIYSGRPSGWGSRFFDLISIWRFNEAAAIVSDHRFRQWGNTIGR